MRSFACFEELWETLSEPVKRKGWQTAQKYRQRTPATLAPRASAGVAAGVVSRRWTVRELLSYPLL